MSFEIIHIHQIAGMPAAIVIPSIDLVILIAFVNRGGFLPEQDLQEQTVSIFIFPLIAIDTCLS